MLLTMTWLILIGHNFGRSFLGHHCGMTSLSDQCLGVEKKISKEIMHFHYMTYKSPCSGVHEIYIFGRPSLVIIAIYMYIVCLISA